MGPSTTTAGTAVNGNGYGKLAVTAIISILAASGFWNLLYADRPTRAEVQEIVDRDSRATVEALKELRQEVREVKQKVDRLAESERKAEQEPRWRRP